MSEHKKEHKKEPRKDNKDSDEHRLVAERKRKLAEVREKGIDPYPSVFRKTHYARDLQEKFSKLKNEEHSENNVKVAGRLMAMRSMGKAAFAHVMDCSGKIQLYLRADDIGKEEYKLLKKFDIGDFIGVEGEVFKTKTGEISIYVKKFQMLTKSIKPLPEKFHGLKDQELRYRQRYLDLVMNPEVKETFMKRSKTISAMREFLTNRDFVEVETPILQPIYGGTNARPFESQLNALNMKVYMRISDELYLKRLIVGGYEKVFEFCPDFRNEGIDKTHNPEFLQMETMWAYANYEDNMDFVEEMIEFVVKKVNDGKTKLIYQGKEIDFKRPWKRVRMVDAIKEELEKDVSDMDLEALRDFAEKSMIDDVKSMNWGELVESLFEKYCEEKIDQPTLILDFPAETSPLAKKKADNPKFVERFEIMLAGWELGNIYSELNDPQVLRENWEAQRKMMDAGDDEAQPMDEDFINALEIGMPPTSGVGIGMDRLIMVLTDSPSIRDVILFPFMKPEN
ncbi:MAG: lysine--tRNA ligase [Nanoarchaeota archaeon]|nr:lysine--tRNA ligase [Nanoarchaeota archaeon]